MIRMLNAGINFLLPTLVVFQKLYFLTGHSKRCSIGNGKGEGSGMVTSMYSERQQTVGRGLDSLLIHRHTEIT